MPSTVIAAFDYDDNRQTLMIRFVSGSVYEYCHVPMTVFEAMKLSRAKGIFYNEHIKNKYSHSKVSDNQ